MCKLTHCIWFWIGPSINRIVLEASEEITSALQLIIGREYPIAYCTQNEQDYSQRIGRENFQVLNVIQGSIRLFISHSLVGYHLISLIESDHYQICWSTSLERRNAVLRYIRVHLKPLPRLEFDCVIRQLTLRQWWDTVALWTRWRRSHSLNRQWKTVNCNNLVLEWRIIE